MSGTLKAIFITAEKGAPMEQVESVKALANKGLEGDRYATGRGSLSRWSPGKRQVTLISMEMLDALEEETGVRLAPKLSRRNLLVSGIDLEGLMGQEFQVGSVRMKAVRTCQPCKYLERKTGLSLLPGMIGKGGIRAQILGDGVLRVGDPIAKLEGAVSRPGDSPDN